MRWAVLCVGVLGFAAGRTTVAQQAADFPKTPPPEFVVVGKVDKAQQTLKILTVSPFQVTVVVNRVVERDGKKATKQELVVRKEFRPVESSLSLKAFRVLDMAGKELQGEELWKRLTPGKMVLRQTDEHPLDRAYRPVFSRDALLIAPRGEETQVPGGSVRAVPY